MAPLPRHDLRHPWIKYQVDGYDEGIVEYRKALFTSHAWRRLFELDEARRRMTWRQFMLALGLHSKEEMAEARDFLGPAPSYVHIRDPLRRLYHRMIACSIFGRGQEAKKVTRVDLFNLRTMDRGTANVPYLLAKYLFRHAEGRKNGAWLSGGHFIGQLAAHFGLVGDQGLRGLSVVVSELLQAVAAGALGATEDAPTANEGTQAVPAPV
ncbi:hypothetical protein Tco_0413870 [Tanacetum coccineum]